MGWGGCDACDCVAVGVKETRSLEEWECGVSMFMALSVVVVALSVVVIVVVVDDGVAVCVGMGCCGIV